ncbi:hypothetical protein GW930_02835 [Candidatus Saccharibacteria bacterium]|nr:hypothetical protein [Candidatus Saccharibacteria bacterium]
MTNELIVLKAIPDVRWTKVRHQPICREHGFELDGVAWDGREWGAPSFGEGYASNLLCLEGPHIIKLPSRLDEIQAYISKKIRSKAFSDAKLIDLDGLLVPVSKKEKISAGGTDYFVTSQVKNGKRGDQVVVYAGKKGSKDRAQISIDPEHKKMSFDQNDLNPADVFVKLEATFRDGTRHTIDSGDTE